MSGTTIIVLVIVIAIVANLVKAYKDGEERQKAERFKETNPEEYVKLRQMEHEREIMAHDQKRMNHEKVQTGAGFFAELFRSFIK